MGGFTEASPPRPPDFAGRRQRLSLRGLCRERSLALPKEPKARRVLNELRSSRRQKNTCVHAKAHTHAILKDSR